LKKILFIDDSTIQLRIMKGLLDKQYEVLTATSGLEGAELARSEQPDLIFLDYDMPILDGRATMHILKEHEESAKIPVIFLTGVNDKKHIEEVLKLLPQGYLLKPVEPDRLFESIRKNIGE
jgi:CheY-like chemotaxis protein